MALCRRRPFLKVALALLLCAAAAAQLVFVFFPPSSSFLTSPERLRYEAEETFAYKDELIDGILNFRRARGAWSRVPRNAAERNAVVLLKTHKTGSSTLQNILIRYGSLRDLNFALPQGNRASFAWPQRFRRSFVMRQRVREFHIMCHHMVLAPDEIRSVMPPDAAFVTIVRHPVDVFESAYEYFDLQRHCYGARLDEFYTSPAYETMRTEKCAALRMPVRNFMAADFGLPLEQMDNDSAVYELIQRINQTFDLVLINELFDLSLVALRRTLNWSVADVVALPQNARGKTGRGRVWRDPILKEEILKYNRADLLIYEHFLAHFRTVVLRRFNRKELRSDLRNLRNLTALWRERCVERAAPKRQLADRNFRPYGSGTSGYVLKGDARGDVLCRLLALPELSLTRWLKHRAIARNRYGTLPYFPPEPDDITT